MKKQIKNVDQLRCNTCKYLCGYYGDVYYCKKCLYEFRKNIKPTDNACHFYEKADIFPYTIKKEDI